jgi:hypothetical protein
MTAGRNTPTNDYLSQPPSTKVKLSSLSILLNYSLAFCNWAISRRRSMQTAIPDFSKCQNFIRISPLPRRDSRDILNIPPRRPNFIKMTWQVNPTPPFISRLKTNHSYSHLLRHQWKKERCGILSICPKHYTGQENRDKNWVLVYHNSPRQFLGPWLKGM